MSELIALRWYGLIACALYRYLLKQTEAIDEEAVLVVLSGAGVEEAKPQRQIVKASRQLIKVGA